MSRFIALGGDGRTEFMAKHLSKNGFETITSNHLSDIQNCDAFILPLPFTIDNKIIKGTTIPIDDFLKLANKNTTIFIGKANEYVSRYFSERNIPFYDYNARDEFAQKNAVPTAQGVLSFVLNNINVTVNSLTVSVIGYGKCGKSICKTFKNLGANVLSFSRRYSTVADAESDGMKAYLIKDAPKIISNSDVIINTVPVKILGEEILRKTKPEAILIDVSSNPFGFDFDYTESINKKVNILSSLPGKCVPKTAGIIIAETIINIIEEGGLWKKSN
ncbi:MAG: NAD(P)-binding domain-containing protein [Clostridia bacterium]|nr:NAD(P)-binding domain-containing protein [Clostridia bacterium]